MHIGRDIVYMSGQIGSTHFTFWILQVLVIGQVKYCYYGKKTKVNFKLRIYFYVE